MRNYLAEGNNVSTPLELKNAILSKGGPKRTKVAVVDIGECEVVNSAKWANISQIHSIKFEARTITLWRYFNIGLGRKEKYNQTEFIARYVIIDAFNENIRTDELASRTKSDSYVIQFYCNTYGCSGTFDTETELERHELEGSHSSFETSTSVDIMKATYRQLSSVDIERFRVTKEAEPTCNSELNGSINTLSKEYFKPGWGLPSRKTKPLDKDAKSFILQKFNEGEKSGKMSPKLLQTKMREAVDPETKMKLFSKEQLLTEDQIKSLVGRYSSLAKKLPAPSKEIDNILPEVSITQFFTVLFSNAMQYHMQYFRYLLKKKQRCCTLIYAKLSLRMKMTLLLKIFLWGPIISS
jgi:hypothetical protein